MHLVLLLGDEFHHVFAVVKGDVGVGVATHKLYVFSLVNIHGNGAGAHLVGVYRGYVDFAVGRDVYIALSEVADVFRRLSIFNFASNAFKKVAVGGRNVNRAIFTYSESVFTGLNLLVDIAYLEFNARSIVDVYLYGIVGFSDKNCHA